jgi:hypothetical protein
LLADGLHVEGWYIELNADNKLRLDKLKLGMKSDHARHQEFDAKPEVSRDAMSRATQALARWEPYQSSRTLELFFTSALLILSSIFSTGAIKIYSVLHQVTLFRNLIETCFSHLMIF